MNIGILYYTPNERTKEFFEQVYQALTPKEYGELNQTGIYGKYNTEDTATEFTLYKGKDNKIGIIFKNTVAREGKFEDEIKIIFIDSDEKIDRSVKDYLNNYTHFMTIVDGKNFISTLEAIKKENEKKDYICTSEKHIHPKEKITIILEQNDTIKCTVMKDKYGRLIKTKVWKNKEEIYSEDLNEKLVDDIDRYLEKGKELPIWFNNLLDENKGIIEAILKRYLEEQSYITSREGITMTQSGNQEKKL